MTPFFKQDKQSGITHSVPCGRCPQCVSRRVSAWAFRLMQEEKRSVSAWFLTFTYGTDTVPISQKGYMVLYKHDLQTYFKRLRKLHTKDYPGRKLSYYAVGEYGGRRHRPHYHILLFNAQLELIAKAWECVQESKVRKQRKMRRCRKCVAPVLPMKRIITQEVFVQLKHKPFKHQVNTKTRTPGKSLGEIYYGSVTGASIGYCLKYMCKARKFPLHSNDDRISEFALMSKGLGENYVTEKMKRWHKADLVNRMYLNLEDGKKASMPRYYKDKIYTLDERSVIKGYWAGEAEKTANEFMQLDPIERWNHAQAVEAAFGRMYDNYFKLKKIVV